MSKNIKIFLVKGISVNFDNEIKNDNQLISVIGYFTNLKELYSRFDPKTIQSYSTVSNHLNKKGFYKSKKTQFANRKSIQSFNEITITQVKSNTLYQKRDYISLSNLLKKESSNINVRQEFLNF